MGSSSIGRPQARCCLGFYALVSYIPDPLGAFLNGLKEELAPGNGLHAHLTLLPPRALQADPAALVAALGRSLAELPGFEVTLGDVELFEGTNVIYLGLAGGRETTEAYHRRLSGGLFAFNEPFRFHPHITLAQNLDPSHVAALLAGARMRWRRYAGPRSFVVERLVFVRNETPTHWETLSQHTLAQATLQRTR